MGPRLCLYVSHLDTLLYHKSLVHVFIKIIEVLIIMKILFIALFICTFTNILVLHY